jgi:hypothetical protein
VDNIRAATLDAPSVSIEPRRTISFSQFTPVTSKEILDLLTTLPAKSCLLDPIPSWLIETIEGRACPGYLRIL